MDTYFFHSSDAVSVTNHKTVTLDSLDLTWRRLEMKGKKVMFSVCPHLGGGGYPIPAKVGTPRPR